MIARPRQTEQMDQTEQMEQNYRIDRLRTEGKRLIDVASHNLKASVPTCPGWNNERLLSHTSRVWASMARQVGQRATELLDRDGLPRPGDEGVVAFSKAQLDALVDALSDVDPAEPMWTWAADKTAGFYLRRAHQETLVHRVDAELASGSVTAVPVVDAADGIDELVSVVYRPDISAPEGSLHLHQSDGDGEWMLEARSGGGVQVRREHAKGAAALRGRAEDLWLLMWGRRGYDDIATFGDMAVINAWVALAP